MKKSILFLAVIACLSTAKAQPVLDHVYPTATNKYVIGTQLHNGGFKYLLIDIPALKLYLYNTNNTLYNTITLPSLPTGVNISSIAYVSDNLFDTDNMIEYVIIGNMAGNSKFYIYKENGTQVMYRDSSHLGGYSYIGANNMFTNGDAVFYDGVKTRLRITTADNKPTMRDQVFILPGTIPCLSCETKTVVTKTAEQALAPEQEARFYPNPVIDQLKLKYNLPKDYKTAAIRIMDMQGKLLEEFKITDVFDFIYLPSGYNNGLYLYSLIIDGKTIKTEKIVLNK